MQIANCINVNGTRIDSECIAQWIDMGETIIIVHSNGEKTAFCPAYCFNLDRKGDVYTHDGWVYNPDTHCFNPGSVNGDLDEEHSVYVDHVYVDYYKRFVHAKIEEICRQAEEQMSF